MDRVPIITGMAGVINNSNIKCGDILCNEKIELIHSNNMESLGHSLSYRKPEGCKLLDYALEKALKNSAIELSKLQNNRKIGIIIGTTNGLTYDQSVFLKELYEKQIVSPFLFSQTAHNYLSDTIVAKYKISGFSTCLFNGWTSGLDALLMGFNMIRNGRLDTVIIGCVDTLSPLVLDMYNQILGDKESLCYKNGDFILTESSGVIIIEEKNKKLSEKNYLGKVIEGGQTAFYSNTEFTEELGCILKSINHFDNYFANINHTNLDRLEFELIKKYQIESLKAVKTQIGECGAVSGIIQLILALGCDKPVSLIVNVCYAGKLTWVLVERKR